MTGKYLTRLPQLGIVNVISSQLKRPKQRKESLQADIFRVMRRNSRSLKNVIWAVLWESVPSQSREDVLGRFFIQLNPVQEGDGMEQKIKEVAERIQGLREICGISQEEMAEKTDVSLERYQELEAGEADFSFTFIYKCAQTMNVEVKDLLEGTSPRLSSYVITRNGDGMSIARREGFTYKGIASLFKGKMAEPFLVTAPYQEEEKEIQLSTHVGQELDIVLKGSLKVRLEEHEEILWEGDAIYYDSSTPHGMIAAEGEDCTFIAVVMNPAAGITAPYIAKAESAESPALPARKAIKGEIAEQFIHTVLDEKGILQDIAFRNTDTFNFAFDVVDVLAKKCPDKLAMLHLTKDKTERRFTYQDMSRYSSMTANYFQQLGIRKGDRVMLVLKRHYQFWYAILALHKIGAIVIPATNLLVEHDFDYRYQAAGISAIVCTAEGDVAQHAEVSAAKYPQVRTKILVGGKREGWHDFDAEFSACSDVYEVPEGETRGEGQDPMLMYFTSGTTGYPKIATHTYTYPLGHYITAKYWHNVNPEGLHFTISDTGWGKALWGKLYGQWLCEAAVFTYDFEKFDASDLLPLFAAYQITTFCAPPTMYRFFIKEDLAKYDLSSLEYTTIAGEALNPEVFQQFYKATGLKLMEGFGQTETTLAVANLIGTEPKPGSMGKPSPLFDVDIVDAEGRSAQIGEVGEIVIRTGKEKPCGLFTGYYQDEELTREAWYEDLYHTGDTAWKDEDGYYWYVGRTDDLIKSSGYRIGPFEIESVIMELPYILECAVTGEPDEIRGQVVKATVVLTKGTEPSEELKQEIQNYVKEHTAPYKYPRIVEFIEELPKTISGKIRRVELRGKQ